MTDFGTAKLISGIVEFAGWLIVVVATFAFFVFLRMQGVLVAAGGGIFIAFCGLLLVATAQFMRAQIVTAESAEHTAKLITKLLQIAENSAQTVPQRRKNSTPSATYSERKEPVLSNGKLIREIGGLSIFKQGNLYVVEGNEFQNLAQAEAFIRKKLSELE